MLENLLVLCCARASVARPISQISQELIWPSNEQSGAENPPSLPPCLLPAVQCGMASLSQITLRGYELIKCGAVTGGGGCWESRTLSPMARPKQKGYVYFVHVQLLP